MGVAISKEVTLSEFVEMRIGDIFVEVAELVAASDLTVDDIGGVAWGLFKGEMYLKECWREFVAKGGRIDNLLPYEEWEALSTDSGNGLNGGGKMEFDMLRLGAGTLADVGGNPDPFLERIEELEERWAALEAEVGRLQQDIYEAVQAVWKRRREERR